jgi:hypothetical protein
MGGRERGIREGNEREDWEKGRGGRKDSESEMGEWEERKKMWGGRENGRKKGIERVVVSWSAVNRWYAREDVCLTWLYYMIYTNK